MVYFAIYSNEYLKEPAGGPAPAQEPEEIDAYDLLEPVAALKRLPQNFYKDLNSPKWSERKDALEEFLKVASSPRLAEEDYQELVAVLSKASSA